MMKKIFATVFAVFFPFFIWAASLSLSPDRVIEKVQEMMRLHPVHRQLTPLVIERALSNFLEALDPSKSYFLASEIAEWSHPSQETLKRTLVDYQNGEFTTFHQIREVMVEAIARHRRLVEQVIDAQEGVETEDLKDLDWVDGEKELLKRIEKIRSLQIKTTKMLTEGTSEHAMARIEKYRMRAEERLLTNDAQQLLIQILKATASALDSQSAYFTPEEAQQLLIDVQQRLFGIGAQLRDDLSWITVTGLIEGGTAAKSGKLLLNDHIIAVDGEPIVGMEIHDAVKLIRGKEGTPVVLTVLRENDQEKEERLDIELIRSEVLIEESRFSFDTEPFGEGVIAHLHLFSFYQDPNHSSATDLLNELRRLKEKGHLAGCILDLRNNTGGMLSEAVAVASLFMSNGIVVSIKEGDGTVHHLRNTDPSSVAWDGPLLILVNRMSASASEIVAQTLQDYGRAIVAGDEQTFGKGSFQLFSLKTSQSEKINPEGEYKVTMGRYYTVSGVSPQLRGVRSDIVVPGVFADLEVGEKFSKYPLAEDVIDPHFHDDLSDLPYFQRKRVERLYQSRLQQRLSDYTQHLPTLRANSAKRLEKRQVEQADPQLQEAYQIMKDLLFITGQR